MSSEQTHTFQVSPCFKSSSDNFFWLIVFLITIFFSETMLWFLYHSSAFFADLMSPRVFVFAKTAITLILAICALTQLAKVFNQTLGHSIIISPHHVEFVVGIASKRKTKINIAHIRTIDIEQTLAERLLNVGTIRIAASSTESYEIEAAGISHPELLREYLKHRVGVLQFDEAPNPAIYYR